MRRIVLLTIAMLAGCAGITDTMTRHAGLGVLSEEVATFDGSTTVTVSPANLWADGKWKANNIRLGARWNSTQPDVVALILNYEPYGPFGGPSFAIINGLDINLDGKISSHKTIGITDLQTGSYNSISRSVATSSTNHVALPLATLKQMVVAKDCRLRITTSNGTEDAQFSLERIPGSTELAIVPIREFLARVDQLQQAKP